MIPRSKESKFSMAYMLFRYYIMNGHDVPLLIAREIFPHISNPFEKSELQNAIVKDEKWLDKTWERIWNDFVYDKKTVSRKVVESFGYDFNEEGITKTRDELKEIIRYVYLRFEESIGTLAEISAIELDLKKGDGEPLSLENYQEWFFQAISKCGANAVIAAIITGKIRKRVDEETLSDSAIYTLSGLCSILYSCVDDRTTFLQGKGSTPEGYYDSIKNITRKRIELLSDWTEKHFLKTSVGKPE